MEITQCEVCKTLLPSPVLDLGMQPLCDDLVPVGETRSCKLYPTAISICPVCITAYQKYPVPKEELFTPSYHYRAHLTQDVLNGMRQLVDSIGNVDGKVVWDIGCNDGSLLSIFKERGAFTYGIEPTNAAKEAFINGHNVLPLYFDKASASRLLELSKTPDIITFTNVFAHIESLEEAIEALKLVMGKNTLLVIENHYLGSVLVGKQFDTFYHEHPRTYSLESFKYIAARLDKSISKIEFPSRYGGNIRVYISNSPDLEKSVRPDERAFPEQLAELQGFVDDWVPQMKEHLWRFFVSGYPIYGKGFPARASILINLIHASTPFHPCIFEKEGSPKIGHYVPGTLIPIVSDEEWIKHEVEPEAMLIWAWHIEKEVTNYLHKNKYGGKTYRPLPSFQEINE